jgi:hypothetical protein
LLPATVEILRFNSIAAMPIKSAKRCRSSTDGRQYNLKAHYLPRTAAEGDRHYLPRTGPNTSPRIRLILPDEVGWSSGIARETQSRVWGAFTEASEITRSPKRSVSGFGLVLQQASDSVELRDSGAARFREIRRWVERGFGLLGSCSQMKDSPMT